MSTATEDKELLDGLTEVERAMLAEANDDTNQGSDDGADDAGNDDQDGSAGADDAAGAGDDADTGAAAGRDDGANGDAGTSEPEGKAQQAAPLLVAEAPADAEAKLKEIADSKSDLRKKYDDGDLTFEEYEAEKDKLDEQRLEIKMAVKEAETAAKMAQQQARNEFLSYAAKFTTELHPEYAKDKDLYEALDKQVIELANIPKYAGLSGQEILDKAHKLILIDNPDKFAVQPKPADTGKKPAPKREVNLPPNLAKVPSADMNDTGEGRFAHLDRLAERGGMAFEQALAALSEAERNAYLAQ